MESKSETNKLKALAREARYAELSRRGAEREPQKG
jgi:hypothetical protein